MYRTLGQWRTILVISWTWLKNIIQHAHTPRWRMFLRRIFPLRGQSTLRPILRNSFRGELTAGPQLLKSVVIKFIRSSLEWWCTLVRYFPHKSVFRGITIIISHYATTTKNHLRILIEDFRSIFNAEHDDIPFANHCFSISSLFFVVFTFTQRVLLAAAERHLIQLSYLR